MSRISKAYITIGFLFISFYLQGQDQTLADSLIKVYSNIENNNSQKFDILLEICFNHTNPDTVLKYASILVDFAATDSSHLWLHRGFMQQGDAHKLKGDLEEALSCYFKSSNYASLANYSIGLAGANSAIGSVYRVQGNRANSFLYYNQAISIFRQEQDTLRLASSLLNTGDLYRESSQFDTALLYFEESQALFAKVNYEIGIAYNLGNIGLVYAERGEHDLAEKNINEASLILNGLGDRYPIAVYDTYMADIYQQKGDFNRALQYAGKSYQVAKELGLKEQIRDASLKLSELYQSIGDYEQAYAYQSQYIAYRDSINNEETIRKMADLRTEYEVSQKQAEVDLLETQKRIQQIIVFAMAVVLLLLVALAYTLYRNNQQKQATNHLLAEQKEEIETQKDQLEELNHTKDKFFSIISHDLRGPVNSFKAVAILTKLCIEEKRLEDLPEVYQHFDNSIDQLSTLLDTLLDWAVTQQGAISYQPEKVDLAEVTQELIDLFINMANAKKIQLSSDIDHDLFLWVDINSLKTILRNLVNNALKFTQERGEITLAAIADEHIQMAKIKVQDTGVGIPKEKLSSIFKLGDHNRSWGTQGEKGLGLGLQLVEEFTQMNRGTIRIESQENIGTTVHLDLPLYPSNDSVSVQERSLSKS